MRYNDAESITKSLEAEGHDPVRIVSHLTKGATDPADERNYEVSVKAPVDPDQLAKIREVAEAHGATVEEHENNIRIS